MHRISAFLLVYFVCVHVSAQETKSAPELQWRLSNVQEATRPAEGESEVSVDLDLTVGTDGLVK
ncbi:MAG: hypothetical protein R3A47_11450 [Polyangiales bacterium]